MTRSFVNIIINNDLFIVSINVYREFMCIFRHKLGFLHHGFNKVHKNYLLETTGFLAQ